MHLIGFCPGLQTMAYSRSSVSEERVCLHGRITALGIFTYTEDPWGRREVLGGSGLSTACLLTSALTVVW